MDPVNPEHAVQHLVVQPERLVQLFLVDHLEPGLGVVPQLAALLRDVVLTLPVGEEDRPCERLPLLFLGEVLDGGNRSNRAWTCPAGACQ